MTKVSASQPNSEVLYHFTPNINFNHKDDLGNIISGYEKDMPCSVRKPNTKLHALVQKWLNKPALDEKDQPILNSGVPLMLCRLGR